jgi:hypothetical protein
VQQALRLQTSLFLNIKTALRLVERDARLERLESLEKDPDADDFSIQMFLTLMLRIYELRI